jgi:chromosome segregation ATPase
LRWDPLFDPALFLEKMVDMTGNSSRFNNTPTDELMRMSLGHELKGLLLNYALAIHQKQELATANDKMALVDKNLASIEKQYAAPKETIRAEVELLKSQHLEVMSKLAKAHEEELAKAKKDQDAAVKTAKALQEDLTAKEERLATLAKDNEAALSELAFLRQEKVKWEFEKESLEENIGTQYDEGFSYAIE